MIRRILIGLVCLASLLASMPFLMAQTATTGQISGDVVDPTGAVVSGAKLVLKSETGLQREATSDGAGRYLFPLLPPGSYSLEVSAPGFAILKVQDIVVTITATAVVNPSLKIATTTEALTVTATPPLVQSETASQGRVMEQDTIRELPLPTRNFQQLLALTPGTSGSLQNSSELGRGDAAIYVNGQRAVSNAVVLNGVDANSIGTGSTPNLAVPATDSMQEFVVQTSLYDATQGRAAGGVIAAVTKSGTNSYHGSLYYFLRDTNLNANNYFLNQQGIKRPRMDRRQAGATFGGPIKKDRVHFFLSYQNTYERNGASLLNSLATVFAPGDLPLDRTDANLAAMYNDYFGPFGQYLYNPNSVQARLLKATLPDGSYVIPSPVTPVVGSITPVATPMPRLSTFDENQFNINLDFKVSEKNQLALKFFSADNPTKQALYSSFGSQNAIPSPGFGAYMNNNQRVFAVEDTHIFTPMLLNVFHFGGNNLYVNSIPDEPVSSADIGISSPLGNMFAGMPTMTFLNMMDIGIAPLSDNVSETWTYTWSDMLTWTKGKHTLKFGGDFKHHQADLVFNAYTRGQVMFYGLLGNAFADFLYGMPTVSIIGSGDPQRSNRANDFSGFLQDDWRIAPRFTLNLGLRYDYYGAFTEKNGKFVAFDPTLMLPGDVATGFVQAGNGNLPGIAKVQDSLLDPDRNNFAPRIGFTYQPFKENTNILFRGGYGIYYDRPNSRLLNSQVFNAPYYSVALNIATAVSYPSLSSPFVQVPEPSAYPLPIGSVLPGLWNVNDYVYDAGTGLFLPQTLTLPISATGLYPDRHNFRTPYVQQYNFGVQYGLKDNWLVEIGYVGSTGHKMSRLRNINQGALPGAPGSYYPGLSAAALPTFGTYLVESSANSSYNSLQGSITKRFSHGLQFMASYTYGHSIDDFSGTDVSDLGVVPGDQFNLNNRATSDFDRRHRLVLNYLYELPKAYKGDSGIAKRALNGWQLAGIVTAQTGVPFTIFGNSSTTAVTRADYAPGANSENVCGSGDVKSRLGQYFDTSAFVMPAAWGNTGRNICRGPSQSNVDFSVIKLIPIVEKHTIEFRGEFFNLFNTVNFANPVSVRSSANFGQIVRTSTGPRVIQFALKYSF